MDNDTVSLPITSFQSTLQHILCTAAFSGTTSGSSHVTRSQTLHLALHCRQQQHLLGWEIGAHAILHFREQENVARGQVGTIGWMSY